MIIFFAVSQNASAILQGLGKIRQPVINALKSACISIPGPDSEHPGTRYSGICHDSERHLIRVLHRLFQHAQRPEVQSVQNQPAASDSCPRQPAQS